MDKLGFLKNIPNETIELIKNYFKEQNSEAYSLLIKE